MAIFNSYVKLPEGICDIPRLYSHGHWWIACGENGPMRSLNLRWYHRVQGKSFWKLLFYTIRLPISRPNMCDIIYFMAVFVQYPAIEYHWILCWTRTFNPSYMAKINVLMSQSLVGQSRYLRRCWNLSYLLLCCLVFHFFCHHSGEILLIHEPETAAISGFLLP